MLRDVLGYNLAKHYLDCPKANFAKIYVNGSYIGLYSNTEPINKPFCNERFFSSNNTFVECSPVAKPAPNVKSNLKFIPGSDSTAYFDFYEIKSKSGWKDLLTLCDSVTNNPASIENVMDVDRLIWMLAFDNVTDFELGGVFIYLIPNPCSDFIEIIKPNPLLSTEKIIVNDFLGNNVADLTDRLGNSGYAKLFWDLKDNTGKRLVNGLYFVKFHSGNSILYGKFIISR